MAEFIKVDALGDACPLPVVKAKKAISELQGAGQVEVLVDNEIAVQNLTKMAQQKGYQYSAEKLEERKYRVLFTLGEAVSAPAEDAPVCTSDARTDTVVAIVRRKLSGRPAMEADKMHLHHRLLAMGFTHRGAVLVVYAIATLFSLIALLLNVSSRLGGILLLLSLLLGMEILIEGLEIWGVGRTPLFNFLKFIGNSDYRQATMLKWKQGRKN